MNWGTNHRWMRTISSVLIAFIMLLGTISIVTPSVTAKDGAVGDAIEDRSAPMALAEGDGLVGPFTSEVVDVYYNAEFNGLFDLLVVSYSIQMSSYFEGMCYVELFDTNGYSLFWTGKPIYQSEGTTTYHESFSGSIFYNRAANGPYTVNIRLQDSSETVIDSETFETMFYSYDQFDHAKFVGDAIEHAESDSGTLPYQWLVLEADVDVSIEGDYSMYCWLITQNWLGSVYTQHTFHLVEGLNHVVFDIPAYQVYSLGYDGPYIVQWNLMSLDGLSGDERYFDSRSYLLSDFYSYVPINELGEVTNIAGYDDDADKKFEWIAVDLTVEVGTADYFMVWGYLSFDVHGVTINMADAYTWAYLEPGTQEVRLLFPGECMSSTGYRGTCNVYLNLYGSNGYLDYMEALTPELNGKKFAKAEIDSSILKDKMFPKRSISQLVLHGSDDLDVGVIDTTSLYIANMNGWAASSEWAIRDVDRDGHDDLVMNFNIAELKALILTKSDFLLLVIYMPGIANVAIELKNVKM
jgi:hypothetical protein